MPPNNKIGATADRTLSPERWDLIKQEVLIRARAERAKVLLGAVGALAAGVRGGLRRAIRAFARWRERQRAIRHLHALDHRSLRDIGISRSEIESAVRCWDSTRIPRGVLAHRAPRGSKNPAVRKHAA